MSDAIPQTFSLTISHGSTSQVISLNDSFYYFTAPEDAPPCEVYNFSVTATYVGATYTGAGCSVPSPVISTMLPSLPDIRRLNSSLNHSLDKVSGDVTLSVYFEVNPYYYPAYIIIHSYAFCCFCLSLLGLPAWVSCLMIHDLCYYYLTSLYKLTSWLFLKIVS